MLSTIDQTKKQPTEWEKIFSNSTPEMGLIPKILYIKNSYNLAPKTPNHLSWTRAESPNGHFSDRTHRQPTDIQKMCNVTEKCKLKPPSSVTSHLSEWPASKTSANNRWGWGLGENGPLLPCGWERNLVQPLWKTVWRFLKRLKIGLP